MSDPEKKNVLVTGCTSGIGLEIARYLHETGYNILLVGRNREKLKTVSDQLGGALYYECDLEHSENIKEIFSFCRDSDFFLNGMIHSAGYAVNMPVRSYREDDMQRQMQIHYYAFLELCKQFYSRKISCDGASIIALSSLASITKRKGSVLYSASKNALNTAVAVISKEFLRRAIRVNAVMPAYVDTRMNDGIEELINISECQPMGLIPPRDVAFLTEFLLSDKSKYITGALIPVSAGMEV